MMSNKIKYYIGEAFKSIGKNRITSIVSVSTAVATMFILGLFLILSLNVNDVAVQVSRDCEIQVFISDDCDMNAYESIGNEIKKIQHVSDALMYTKEQIFEEVKIKLGDKADMLVGLENDNPYRNSFKVNLDDLAYVNEVSDALAKINGVEKVSDVQSLANTIVNVVNAIQNVSLWLVLLLCIVTAFIVSNAIKVSVYARRKEINIMKYIGATDAFIRWPFIIEGIIIGLIGAIISFLLIWTLYSRIPAQVSEYVTFFKLLAFENIALTVIGTFSVVGIVIGVSGSIMSLRKHLRV
ncbi:MAG: permease-like cell division protein FtsX [Clostridia bacterium]|nr:permease-like cell division protein FtsX [Clostridia bacterium]